MGGPQWIASALFALFACHTALSLTAPPLCFTDPGPISPSPPRADHRATSPRSSRSPSPHRSLLCSIPAPTAAARAARTRMPLRGGSESPDSHQFRVPVWEGVLNYVNLWPLQGAPALNTGAAARSQEGGEEEGTQGDGGTEGAAALSASLRKSITMLYGKHVAEDGSGVDYRGLGESGEFEEYKGLARKLQHVNVGSMGEDEKVAFFVNIYNSLLIHSFAELGTPADMLSRLRLYAVAKYDIGGLIYSLNDIENGILRGNAKPPTPLAKQPFREGDGRREFACANPDPRIHFALNCGAKGCPAIRFYKAEKLDADLGRAAEAFCSGVEVDEGGGAVKVSMIFQWYREDFAANDEGMLRYIQGHVKGPKSEAIERLIAKGGFKIQHLPYDWDLNSK